MMSPLRQQFRNWAFRRNPEAGPIVLNQRRIYILPTRQGLFFGFVLALMLLGDINYNLSLGYVLTFLLATTGALSMLYAFRNMAQLQVTAGRAEPVFAGEQASFILHFHNDTDLPRHQLVLHARDGHQTTFDLPARQASAIAFRIPATRRGWLASGQLGLYTEFPLGLFHAWSYLHFEQYCLVYPQPAAASPLPAATALHGTGMHSQEGDEDFAGLRNYQPGDALPRIAWKTLAREQEPQVKKFSANQGSERWLDWSLLPAAGDERKLELLARQVLDASAAQLHYGLRLPEAELPPDSSPAHRDACLKALALHGLDHTPPAVRRQADTSGQHLAARIAAWAGRKLRTPSAGKSQ